MLQRLLYVVWNVDRAICHIGSFELRWYSVLFVIGIFPIGYWIFRWFFRREKVDEKLLEPLLYTILIATVVGARLGHCLFYQPDYFFGSWKGFLEIFMPWHGGLASHGGAIALLLAMGWFTAKYGRKNGFDFLWIMDRLVIPVCFAGALIRLGNLMNSEIYGDVTTLPWGFIFVRAGETLPKHPTQLYEALSYTLIGALLLWMYAKRLDRLKQGTIFGLFLILLFGARFLIEFVKEPQVEFENAMTLDMGQWLSVPFILAGVVLLVWSLRKGGPAAARTFREAPKKAEPTHYARSLRDG